MPVTPPIDDEQDNRVASRSGDRRIRLGLWVILMVGLLVFLAIGSVSAISYRYITFSQRLIRDDVSRSLVDIWQEQVSDLPVYSIGWLPGAVFVLCLAVVVICTIGGSWLLLVTAGNGDVRRPRRPSDV